MRPRPEGRGELPPGSLPSTSFSDMTCFNAATARRPWRTSARRSPRTRAAGFNAATARRPWRTFWRHMGCALSGTLQCGHGPKAVENSTTLGRRQAPVDELQCGHGPKAVENVHLRFQRHDVHRASMRPRPEGRGEPTAGHGRYAPSNTTSMRPRPEGRGEPRWPPRSRGGRSDFNAATARRPWRTILGRFLPPWPDELQCGHGPKAVENAGERRGPYWRLQTSMRPRPEGRGELAPAVRLARSSSDFNAATARRPWRTCSP